MMEPHNVTEHAAWYYTEKIPAKLVDIMVEELEEMERDKVVFEDAGVGGDAHGRNVHKVRNSTKIITTEMGQENCQK